MLLEPKTVLVIAPHADDETLGCGGTLLRLKNEGVKIHWLLVTGMSEDSGFSATQIETRRKEISLVAGKYAFDGVHELNFPPAQLETVPKGNIIAAVGKVISEIKPSEIFTVYRNDAHSDHEIVYDTTMSCSKSFRYPFIKRVLAYETISETDFGMKPEDGGFRPNVFVNIDGFLNKKLDILECFESEIGEFPFPRSRKAVESLAYVRGAQCNAMAAEAFILIKEIQ